MTEASATPAPGPAAAIDPDTTAAPAAGNGEVLLRAEHVLKYFPIRKGILLQREIARVHAVDDVSFELRVGETLGLVGESGCGKSTLARCIARLYPLTGGTVVFEGRDISRLTRRQLRPVRRDLQMVFQDPYASLNPRKRVGTVIADPLRIHKWGSRQQIKRRVGELLELVGLSPEHVNRYPHEFSGGQRQRIGVARALALHPRLVIADEPQRLPRAQFEADVVDRVHLGNLALEQDSLPDREVLDHVLGAQQHLPVPGRGRGCGLRTGRGRGAGHRRRGGRLSCGGRAGRRRGGGFGHFASSISSGWIAVSRRSSFCRRSR